MPKRKAARSARKLRSERASSFANHCGMLSSIYLILRLIPANNSVLSLASLPPEHPEYWGSIRYADVLKTQADGAFPMAFSG